MKPLLFIPARGGSKTIEMKNLHILNGEPLLHYVTTLAKSLPYDYVVSTDNKTIMGWCEARGIKSFRRSPEYEDGPVINSINEYLLYIHQFNRGYECIVLLQPTSPFISKVHVELVIRALEDDSSLASAQTIIPIPHRMHTLNQRLQGFNGNVVREGSQSRKQEKSKTYAFGNVVATRVKDLHTDQGVFAYPSKGIEIDPLSAMDLDGPDDFIVAEALMKQGVIKI